MDAERPPSGSVAAVLGGEPAETGGLAAGERFACEPAELAGRGVSNGDVTLVADARLDDRTRLQSQLGASDDDAELIMRSYQRWGDDCAAHLTGAFAFVVFDARRGVLLAARDHMGFRPLHWWWDGHRLVLASWAENVLAHPAVPRRPDARAAAALDEKAFGWLLEQSPFTGVRKLAPGGLMIAEPGREPRLSRHWTPGPRPHNGLKAPTECIEMLRETVRVAVADAVRDAEPTAAHLSGGIDSSTIAVLADRELRKLGSRLRCGYSWSPSPEAMPLVDEHDERERIELIARSIGVPVTFVDHTADLDARVNRAKATLAPTTAIRLEHDVLGDAADRGIGVILSGWGGDELASFNGRGWIGGLLRAGRPDRALREAWSLAHARAPDTLRRTKAAAEFLWQDGAKAVMSDRVYKGLGLHRQAYALGGLSPEASLDPLREAAQHAARMSGRDRAGVHATQGALIRHGHLTARIESWAWWGDQAGVSYRYPLLDKRVVELCLELPEYLWWHGGERRWVFRRVAEGILPESIPSASVKREEALRQLLSDTQS